MIRSIAWLSYLDCGLYEHPVRLVWWFKRFPVPVGNFSSVDQNIVHVLLYYIGGWCLCTIAQL
jgi:hypothetical protein